MNSPKKYTCAMMMKKIRRNDDENGGCKPVLVMGWIIDPMSHTDEDHRKLLEALIATGFNDTSLMARV